MNLKLGDLSGHLELSSHWGRRWGTVESSGAVIREDEAVTACSPRIPVRHAGGGPTIVHVSPGPLLRAGLARSWRKPRPGSRDPLTAREPPARQPEEPARPPSTWLSRDEGPRGRVAGGAAGPRRQRKHASTLVSPSCFVQISTIAHRHFDAFFHSFTVCPMSSDASQDEWWRPNTLLSHAAGRLC